MHTRSAKSKETGLFTVTVWDWKGAEYFRGEFVALADAEAVAAAKERHVTRGATAADAPLTLDDLLTDDELVAALES